MAVADYPALLRVQRQHERRSEENKALNNRHRWRVEGVHGEAKTSLAQLVPSDAGSQT